MSRPLYCSTPIAIPVPAPKGPVYSAYVEEMKESPPYHLRRRLIVPNTIFPIPTENDRMISDRIKVLEEEIRSRQVELDSLKEIQQGLCRHVWVNMESGGVVSFKCSTCGKRKTIYLLD